MVSQSNNGKNHIFLKKYGFLNRIMAKTIFFSKNMVFSKNGFSIIIWLPLNGFSIIKWFPSRGSQSFYGTHYVFFKKMVSQSKNGKLYIFNFMAK